MKDVVIYTDGACSGNPGPGGWCAILLYSGHEKVLSGGDAATTNNRMEVLAAIEGLAALKERCKVSLHSDSAYLVNAVEKHWLDGWKRGGWHTADKKDVKNRDLWERLDKLLHDHDVTFVKVKGHADDEYNNRCDEVAREEVRRIGDRA